jgi:hypothetical protein
MKRKILLTVLALAVVLLATPLVSAVPWTYPKNNEKFEEFGVTYGLDFINTIIPATYAAIAEMDNPNKVVVSYEEVAVSYEIRVGEAGPDQRIYTLGDDFEYSGVATLTVFDPILPYNPAYVFLLGRMAHMRVDYMYDFGDDDEGLDGTINLVALWTGGEYLAKAGKITSIKCTGDFQNVQIQAAPDVGSPTHIGVVSGWPE